MSALDLRLENMHALQRLGALVRPQPQARLIGVVVTPGDDGTVLAQAEGIGDERDCICAAIHLLREALTLIETEGPTTRSWPYRTLIHDAARVLSAGVAGERGA